MNTIIPHSREGKLCILQIESRYIECRTNEIDFLISLALVKGGRDVGDPMLKKEKFCERVHAPPTSKKSEN